MKVKICGIMEPLHAAWAVEEGADFLGFIFAPSRRRMSAEKVREIGGYLIGEGLRTRVSTVGVFVNEKPEVVNEIADTSGLDYVQLSGDEPSGYCGLIRRPVIRSVKLALGISPENVEHRLLDEWSRLGANRLAILIEPQVSGSFGGTGRQLDWERVGQLTDRVPVLLAGGLDPENVERARNAVKPWGVDVSSGVETNGIKDRDKIRAFVAAARRSYE